MSDLLHDDDLRTEREPVKELARKWFNWWRANIDLNVEGRTTAVFVRAGSTYIEGPFPSRDVAVSAARDANTSSCGEHAVEYLGAYPEGERP